MAQPPRKRANEAAPRPIIVKKVIVEGHGGHFGGSWKVAYADFVTAMMAFFLLMWLLGATTEKQRKGLADYFTPTIVQMKMDSAGSSGMFGGDSMTSRENYPTTGGQGNLAITIPRDVTGTRDVGGEDLKDRERREDDRQKFERLKRQIEAALEQKALRKLRRHIRFTETLEGLRIDLIDQADFAMFKMGTDTLLPEARALIGQVAQSITGVSNDIIVRGHTDSLPYASGQAMNNWLLSSSRAEATRALLARDGIAADRFARIEGVADREPFVPEDRYDPRNRRISVILTWSQGLEKAIAGQRVTDAPAADAKAPASAAAPRESEAEKRRRLLDRTSQMERIRADLRKQDLGRTALPSDALIVNAKDIPRRGNLTPPGRTEVMTHVPDPPKR